MEFLNVLLLLFILVCAVSVSLTKNLLTSLIIFMSQSLAMSIIWILLQSPDLAITEAAVGAGSVRSRSISCSRREPPPRIQRSRRPKRLFS